MRIVVFWGLDTEGKHIDTYMVHRERKDRERDGER